MNIKTINKDDFITTKWDGGETTQLAIYPEDSIFADRNFLWRLSSASFTSTESNFSDFSGYQRYILPLEGKLELYHQGLYERKLIPYDIEYFDGGWNTFSKNTIDCIDYNFIIKSGYKGKLQLFNKNDSYIINKSQIATLFSKENFTIRISGEDKLIEGFSLLILETDKDEEITILNSSDKIIYTEFSI